MTLYLLPSGEKTWAEELAKKVGFSLCSVDEEPNETEVHLVLSDKGLFLSNETLSYQGDFSALLPRAREYRIGGELLVKAAKPKSFASPRLFDATAGLGEDSFLLAAAGFYVTLCEQNPVIYALLADAMKRGREDERLAPILSRMTPIFGDSIPLLQKACGAYDVVYLDPMFPMRQKSGLIKKKFQLLQLLERPEENGEEMLSAALAAKPKKILVKRPKNVPALGGKAPSYTVSGDVIRYDCIVL